MRIIIKKYIYLESEDRKKVKKFMIDGDFTIRSLAKEIGISHTFFYDILTGKRPTHEDSKFITYLKENGLDLLGEEND